ncbi:MAG TPA: hypothetical protein DCY03_00960 [Planctomycetaceae bacterium]|nr:hypothetical protein [Planctomycetaceae bacterium]
MLIHVHPNTAVANQDVWLWKFVLPLVPANAFAALKMVDAKFLITENIAWSLNPTVEKSL